MAAALVLAGCGQRLKPLEPEEDLSYECRFPPGYQPGDPVSLVVALHGHEQTEKQATDLWDNVYFHEPDFILLSIRAPFRSGAGYAWFKPADDGEEMEPEVRLARSALTDEAAILTVLDQFEEEHGLDEPLRYIAGFSQGAKIAFYVGLLNPAKFAGIASFAGSFDSTLVGDYWREGASDSRVFMAIGRGEGPNAVEAVTGQCDALRRAGASVKLYEHSEGHVINGASCHAFENFFEICLTHAPETEGSVRDVSRSEPEYEYEEEEGEY
jgi:predicted esterase